MLSEENAPFFFPCMKLISCSGQMNLTEQCVFWLEATSMSLSQKSIKMLALPSL